jgi:nucleoside-diphosphate-sugar epimerase
MLTDREAVFLTVAPPQRDECYREVYLGGVENLLLAVDGTAVKRVIYTSSTRVYGQCDGGWVDESSPTEPRDENGRVLVEAERALLAGAEAHGGQIGCGASEDTETPRGLKPAARRHERRVFATVVRLGGIYGSGRDVVARIRSRAGTERSDGDTYVNLIHLDDIVSALSALIDVRHHGVLNLTDDQPEPRREFYDRVLSRADLPPVRWLPGEMPARSGKRVRNDLIKDTLGLVLKHPTH